MEFLRHDCKFLTPHEHTPHKHSLLRDATNRQQRHKTHTDDEKTRTFLHDLKFKRYSFKNQEQESRTESRTQQYFTDMN